MSRYIHTDFWLITSDDIELKSNSISFPADLRNFKLLYLLTFDLSIVLIMEGT